MTRVPKQWTELGWGILAGFVLGVALYSLVGCATPRKTAHRITAGAAEAVAIVDVEAAAYYAATARESLRQAESLADYRARMEGPDALEQGLRVAYEAVELAAGALDIWDEGGEEDWPGLAACVAVALVDLAELVEAAGLDLPEALTDALDMAAGLTRSICEAGD